MRKTTLVVSGLVFGFSCLAGAQERQITRDQLPQAVAAAVDRETQGSTVKGFSTEREHGRKVYEAETVLNGHTRDLQFEQDGTLAEVEEEVEMSSLSPEVRQAITAKAKGAQVTKVESLTKKGKLVAYEAATLKGSKKGEVQVGPGGEALHHEE